MRITKDPDPDIGVEKQEKIKRKKEDEIYKEYGTSNKMVKCNMRKWNKYMERAPLPWRSTGEKYYLFGGVGGLWFSEPKHLL